MSDVTINDIEKTWGVSGIQPLNASLRNGISTSFGAAAIGGDTPVAQMGFGMQAQLNGVMKPQQPIAKSSSDTLFGAGIGLAEEAIAVRPQQPGLQVAAPKPMAGPTPFL